MTPLQRVSLRSFPSVAVKVVFLCLCSLLLLPGCSPNMDSLIADLGSGKPEAAQRAESQLLARKDEAAPALELALTNPSANVRKSACLLLARMEGGRAAAGIARLLADGDASVRAAAVTALTGIGEGAAEGIAANLKDFGASETYLGEAAKCLAGLTAALGDKAAVPLAAALKDSSAAARAGACRLLAAMEGSKAAADIVPLLADADAAVRASALEALLPLGDAAVESYARQYAALAGSESYAQAAGELLGADAGKSVELLSALYGSGDGALDKSVLTLFSAMGEAAYRKFAGGYLAPQASAASKDADLQMLRALGAPAAQWLAALYGQTSGAAEKTEILKLLILASGSSADCCAAAAARLFEAAEADAGTLTLYRSSNADLKAGIVSFLKLAGAACYQRFVPYADAAKHADLAGVVPQVYSDIGLDAVKMLLTNSAGEKTCEGILGKMNQTLVKRSLFGLVDDFTFGDKAAKCIQHIGYPAYANEILTYAKKNEGNKDNFNKAMGMIDSSKPTDAIVKYLAGLRDTSKACAYSAYSKLDSFTSAVPAAAYRPALKYTGSGRSGGVGRVVVLDYLYNGYYNETPELVVNSDTFTSIPAKHMLSCKALGGADAAILVREKIVSIGTWYYVDDPSTHYKGYRIDTEISLIDLKRHQVIYKKVLGEREPYHFDEYDYKGATVMIADSNYDTEEVVDWIIAKYLQ